MFYSIGENEILGIIVYVQGIIADTIPLMVIICGVILGMYILGGLINNKDKDDK